MAKSAVEGAVETLLERGYEVERCEFPPRPFPGLYLVGGRELTEMQLISLANAVAQNPAHIQRFAGG